MDKLVNKFTGGLISDLDATVIPDGDYLDLVNFVNVDNGNKGIGSIKPITGNEIVNIGKDANSTITGVSTCIGSTYTQEGLSVLFFFNDSGYHHIVVDSFIYIISSAFNFSRVSLITHAEVISNRFLVFTDSFHPNSSSAGNPIRWVDLERCSILSNNSNAGVAVTRVFSAFPNTDSFTVDGLQSIEVNVINRAGTLSTNVIALPSLTSRIAFLNWLKTELETLGHSVEMIGETFLSVKSSVVDSYIDVVPQGSGRSVFTTHPSFYPNVITDYHIDLYAYKPYCSPKIIAADKGIKEDNSFYQFRYRYIYTDGRKTAWSHISALSGTINSEFRTIFDESYRVRLDDEKLQDSSFRDMISKVELAVREGNDGLWKRFDTLTNENLGDGVEVDVIFDSTEIYPIVPSDDNTSDGSQTLKLFDHLPVRCSSLAIASDSDNSTRLFLAHNEENYELPQPSYELTARNTVLFDDELIRIVGEIQIQNLTGLSTKPDFDGWTGGFPVYIAGTTYHAVTKEDQGTGNHKFEMWVPKGQYILRVASWKCTYDNQNGSLYNLNNGLEWQKTSSPVLGVNSVGLDKEVILNTASTASGSDFDIGTIYVHNQNYSNEDITWGSGYVRDNFGNFETSEQRIEANGINGCQVTTNTTGSGLTDYKTDHNGYWFLCFEEAGGRFNFANLSVEVPFNQVTQDLIIGDFLGTEQETYDGVDILVDTAMGSVYSYDETGYVNFYSNNNAQVEQFRKTISGSVEKVGASEGVADVAVVAVAGQWVLSDSNGDYSLTQYIPFDSPQTTKRLDFSIYAFAKWQLNIASVITGNPQSGNLDWGTAQSSSTENNFVYTNVVYNSLKGLKAKGSYKIGILYSDKQGRMTPVIPISSVSMPWHSDVNGFSLFYAELKLKHQAPSWAKNWYLVRTKNNNQKLYSQLVLSDVKYVSISQTGNITDTRFEDAKHILVKLQSSLIQSSTSGLVLFGNDSERIGFSVSEGDKLIPLRRSSGSLYDYTNLKVSGQFIDEEDTGVWVVLENNGEIELDRGSVVEVYKPSIIENDIYYIDECYPVIEDNGIFYHGGDTNQSSLVDMTTNTKGADTYVRYKDYLSPVVTGGFPTENIHKTDKINSNWEDIGVGVAEDSDYKNEIRKYDIRFSGTFREGRVNNLSSFRGTDYQSTPIQNGSINGLKNIRENIIAIGSWDMITYYIGKDALLDFSGGTNIGRTDRVMNQSNGTVGSLGTQNPESLTVFDSKLFGYDALRKTFWKFDSNGLQSINGYYDNSIRSLIPSGSYVIGAYDRKRRVYKALLYATDGRPEDDLFYSVLNYSDLSNKWKFRETFDAHHLFFDYVNDEIFTVKLSDLYIHDQSTFLLYGQSYNSIIEFTTNSPMGAKIYKNISLDTPFAPILSEFSVKIDPMKPTLAQSELKLVHWNAIRTMMGANMLRDANDPRFNQNNTLAERVNSMLNGRPLRGENITNKITFTPEQGLELSRCEIQFINYK